MFENLSPKSTKLTALLLLVLTLGFATASSAQCIGPYNFFESFKAKGNISTAGTMVYEGWTFSTSGTTGNSITNSRTGTYFAQLPSITHWIETPKLNSLTDLRFYYRSSNGTNNVNFKVECSADQTFASGVILLGNFTTAGLTYQQANINSLSYSNVYVRITSVSYTTATAAAVFIDDLSCIGASGNNIVVSELGATTTCNPITVPASGSLSYYDQGGASDTYSKSQNQTMYFAPQNGTDKVKFVVNSFNLTDTPTATTTFTVYNGIGTGGTVLLSGSGTSVAPGTQVVSSDASGYLTVVFVSTANTPPTILGFDITVSCVGAASITSLGASNGCLNANLVINGANLLGATSVTINGTAATIVSNTATVITVTPGAGTSGTGPVVVTLPSGNVTSPTNYTIDATPSFTASPSTATQNICLNGSATALSVTANSGGGTISKYEWYSNTTATTSGGTLVATHNTSATTDTYTPLTTAQGTLYYYVVVTNTTSCSVTSAVSGAIVVDAPVVITVQPSTASQSLCLNDTSTALSVTATGGSLLYQWYSNSVSSNSGGTLISGATSSTYTPLTNTFGTKYYYCVVSNGAPCSSSVTSAVSGNVTINPAPSGVSVATSGTYCNSTTITATGGGGATIYFQGTTSNGTSIATPSASQLITTSGTYYFRARSAAGCWGNQGSATITIETVAPSAPTATAATSPTTGGFTANWNSVSGATGYYLDVSLASDFSSFVSGYNNLAVGNVVTYGVTGLSSGGTYYYRVRAIGVCGTSASSNVITCSTVSLSYCIPTAPATTTTSVNSFSTTGGITNISNLNTGFTAGGYASYTAQSCSQYPSSAINYSITSNRTDTTDQTFYYYIWIDWNSDGDFADAGETILATTTYQPGPFTGTFVIPAAQAAGSYRMRVSTSWIGANTSCAINATYGRGEMEDYTIVVVPVPPCSPSTPSALTASSITATGAVISWSDAAMTPNSIYDYYVSTSATTPLSAATPTGTVTGVSSVTLTGLVLGQTYYFWVRSNCGTPNAWVGSGNFTTVNQDVVNMTNGSLTSCNVRFYDSGGSGSNYSDGETYTYTFYPGTANTKLKVVFNSFRTEAGYDGLMIYNGNSTAAPLISSGLAVGTNAATCPAGSYRGTTSPGTIYSTAADGSLTFKFTTDGSVNYLGWDATISCVVVPIISSFTPTNVCAGNTPTVTLTGVNFTGATSVKFNNVSAAFTVVNDTTITTTLPVSATTGYITVSNATSTGTSTTVFSVNPIPSTPSAGSNVAICNGSSTTLNGSSSSTNAVTVLSEDFNTGAWPSAWTRTLNGGYNPGDFRTSSEFLSGGNTWSGNGYTGYCSYFYSYSISSGTSGDMISPAMDLSPYTSASLTFWIYNSSGTDLLKVYANNNNGVYTQVGTNYGTYGSWTQITVNLSSYVGSGFTSVRLKFTGTSDGFSSNIGVDDIQVTGSNTSSFVWSPSASLSNPMILNPVATPTSNTTYTLTTSYASGCSSSSTVTVTVNPKPTVSIPTASANVCGNSVVPVTATGTATTYTWSSSVANTLFTDVNGSVPYVTGANTTNIYVKTPSTATITVTGTDALGCFDTASVTFTVATKTYNQPFWSPSPPVNDGTESLVFNAGTYSSSGNLNACSCTVSGATVTINSGHNLSLVNGLTVTSGSITFNDGASLLQTNNVANSGNIIYRRNSTPCFRYDYTYWSSPVAGQTLVNLSPNSFADGFFEYNPSIPSWQQIFTGNTMTVGKGYLIRVPNSFPDPLYAPAQAFTAIFSGVPNNGTIPLTVVHNPASELNLIGNPYPSALNATALVTDPGFNVNGNFLGGTLYFWSHNTNLNMVTGQYTYSDYAVWNVLGGVNTYYSGNVGSGNTNAPTGNIAAGQGFFAKTLASGTAYFRNSMRTGGATNTIANFYRTASSAQTTSSTSDNGNAFEKHRIWLDIDNGADAYKQLLVGYIEGGSDGLDRLFDGEMVDTGNDVTFYTKIDNTKLTIQGRGLTFAPTDTFALGYKAKVANTYTITLSDYDGLFTNQDIYLEDQLLNVIHNLKDSAYTFASEVGEFENRFVLRFTSETLGLPVFSENSVTVYKNTEGLFVNSGQVPMQSVAIYDVTGRLITTQNNVNTTQVRFATLPKTNQVLLVKITSESGAVVTKKVLY